MRFWDVTYAAWANFYERVTTNHNFFITAVGICSVRMLIIIFFKKWQLIFIYNSLVSMLIHPCWLHNHKWGQKWLLTCMIPWAGTFWDNACKQLHYTVFVHVARHCSLFFNLVEEVLEISCLNSSEFWSLQPVQQLAISFSFSWSSLYWSQFLSFTCP